MSVPGKKPRARITSIMFALLSCLAVGAYAAELPEATIKDPSSLQLSAVKASADSVASATGSSSGRVAYRDRTGTWRVINPKDWPAPPANATRERVGGVRRGISVSSAASASGSPSVVFNIVYKDPVGVGFNDPIHGPGRRAVVRAVFQYISSVLNETGSCDVEFDTSEMSGNTLAASSPLFELADGYNNGIAFSHIRTGVDAEPTAPDISCTVDFGWNWNETTNAPTSDQVDLYSVLLHEMTHGLGLLSLTTSTGKSEFKSYGVSMFSQWDKGIIRQSTGLHLWSGDVPAFKGTSADLLSNDLRFAGGNATTAFAAQGGSGAPPIYAPNPWESGSSISHWDKYLTGRGVMEPAIAYGQYERAYAGIDIGALKDIGYSKAAASSSSDTCIATLSVPGPYVQLQFPQTFSWSLSGTCGSSLSILIASSTTPDASHVWTSAAVASGASLDANTWTNQVLPVVGNSTTYYWTVGRITGSTFVSMADFQPFTVPPDHAPDLLSSAATVSGKLKSASWGEQYKISGSYTVTNAGDVASPRAKIGFYVFSDLGDNPTVWTLRTSSIAPLKPKQTARINLGFSTPRGVDVKNMYFVAVIDPTNAVSELNEHNNVQAFGPMD